MTFIIVTIDADLHTMIMGGYSCAMDFLVQVSFLKAA